MVFLAKSCLGMNGVFYYIAQVVYLIVLSFCLKCVVDIQFGGWKHVHFPFGVFQKFGSFQSFFIYHLLCFCLNNFCHFLSRKLS